MMKKVGVLSVCALLIAMLLIMTGCESDTNQVYSVGGWETMLTEKQAYMDENTLSVFEKANNSYTSMKLDAVGLLGKQVVAGMNYMYLAKGYPAGEPNKATYKTVIVYNDLAGNATVTHVNDFDYTQYVNKNIDKDSNTLLGGWFVEEPEHATLLDESIQTAFNNATSTLTGMSFTPIAVLGKQIVSGTNYAIICYGGPSYENSEKSIYVLTLYQDLTGHSEIVSEAYVNLADYNK